MKVATAVLSVIAVLGAPTARADLGDCQNLYVGRVWLERGTGLYAAVFLNQPGDASGSYWVYFSTWTAEDKLAALALLTAAKLSAHRVNVTTTASGGCGVSTNSFEATSVFLATNP